MQVQSTSAPATAAGPARAVTPPPTSPSPTPGSARAASPAPAASATTIADALADFDDILHSKLPELARLSESLAQEVRGSHSSRAAHGEARFSAHIRRKERGASSVTDSIAPSSRCLLQAKDALSCYTQGLQVGIPALTPSPAAHSLHAARWIYVHQTHLHPHCASCCSEPAGDEGCPGEGCHNTGTVQYRAVPTSTLRVQSRCL